MKVVLASHSHGKYNEFKLAFASTPILLSFAEDLDLKPAVETGESFVENALIKARAAALQSGLPAIADDSGLCVDALLGGPGIHSARYAPGDDFDRINKLLQEMENIPEERRTAAFYCAIVYMEHARDPRPLICTAEWKGRITIQPLGNNGFGYDPVFYVTSENRTAAELSINEKNKLSHRGQALRQFIESIPNKILQAC